jgi:hypothetical protein
MSKILATGEPALNMSIVCLFALRNALDSARRDAGGTDDYYEISEEQFNFFYSIHCEIFTFMLQFPELPATAEIIAMTSLTAPDQFTFE